MVPFYVVTESFGPSGGELAWQRYLEWSSLHQLTELVSLDSILCKPIVDELSDEDWAHVINEDFMTGFFTDLDYLVRRAEHLRERNLLCVFRNPTSQPGTPSIGAFNFRFEGYDLVEVGGGPSALTNCGGFPKAFSNDELSEHGLLKSLHRATEVQRALRQHYPHESHAVCDAWAIFRAEAA